MAGVTNTGAALEAVLPAMQAARRPDVKDIVILLSDGKSNVDEDTVLAAAQALKDDGVVIFSVGESNILLNTIYKNYNYR
jgi:uncharacterized protein with von Willebrand factor type A (vWA) domain